MNIERMKTPPVINIPQRKLFDVCLDMKKLSFPITRKNTALFYIRPDMCIRQQDFDAILNENNTAYQSEILTRGNNDAFRFRSLIDEVIFIPTEAELMKELSGTVNQITETNTSGWFAYANVRDTEENFIKGNGATLWFALADAWINVQKWKLGNSIENANI